MASGKYEETIQFGWSTISEILRSTTRLSSMLHGQMQNGALGDMTGIHVATERSRRHDSRLLGAGRTHAHRPEERLYGDDDVVLEERVIPVGQVEDLEVGVGKILGQQPEAWQHGGPAPACRMDIHDLDRQYVSRFGISHRDGPRERVETVPVEASEHASVGVGPDLSV